jgi:hypothetical protein
MPTDGEANLVALTEAIASDAQAGALAIHLGSLASSQWDPYRGVREDWTAIYNMWLLLGEKYRLESIWHGTLAFTGPKGRMGYGVHLLQYTCFGIWCQLWDVTALVDAARKWCELEKAALRDAIGPSASVVEAFLAGRPNAGAAIEWAAIRRNYSRGGLKRPAVHNDNFPFDVLAPELAWCAAAGQTVPRLSAMSNFPPLQEWPVTSVTERALIAIGSSPWA